MYVKGLDGKDLTTESTTVNMGFNNKAVVVDYPYDDSTYWAYYHDLIGGSFSYTVDVSNVDCACAAGAFFVDLNDEECSWNAKEAGTVPQCANVQVMEANIWGFNTESNPCTFGTCDAESQCKAKVNSDYSFNYGYGADFAIDTSKSYKVTTQFWATKDADVTEVNLEKITTILEQEGRTVEMVMDCPDYINSMSWTLYYNFNLAISTYALDQSNDVSGGTCESACSDASMIIKDLTWVSNDCILEANIEPGEATFGGPAPKLNSGNCGDDCTECREFFYSNFPNDITYECVDTKHYKFGAGCSSNRSRDACMTEEDFCINSWDINDPDRWNSPDAKCRSVPKSHILPSSELKFVSKQCGNPLAGQCALGCDTSCHNSWPIWDTARGKSVYAMCRCK